MNSIIGSLHKDMAAEDLASVGRVGSCFVSLHFDSGSRGGFGNSSTCACMVRDFSFNTAKLA